MVALLKSLLWGVCFKLGSLYRGVYTGEFKPGSFGFINPLRPNQRRDDMEDAGLCEHVSRASRFELASLLVSRLGSPTNLAAKLNITEMAVRKWLLRLTHPSNINLSKMIEIAAELDAQQANEILKNDLAKHQASFAGMKVQMCV
jgi:hypothetical protein